MEGAPPLLGRRDSALAEELVNDSPDGLIAVTFEGTILFWSQGAQQTLEYPRGEAMEQPFFDLLAAPGSAAHARLRAAFDRAIETGATRWISPEPGSTAPRSSSPSRCAPSASIASSTGSSRSASKTPRC
jgi:PAS domain-containing protein